MRRRVLDRSEITLWKSVTRDVTPLSPREDLQEAEPAAPPPIPVKPESAPPQPTAPRRADSPLPLPGMFDSAVERRIAAGRAKVEARLDLHGMTEDEAYRALCAFVEHCAAMDVGLALVVTGKGRMGRGVLRKNLPRWLETPRLRPLVRAVRPAFDRHGGDGASYILFARKQRAPLHR